MKAIFLRQAEGKNYLVSGEIQLPTLKADEVLVKVSAISINPIDVKMLSGSKPLAAFEMIKNAEPIILGWDISGVIVEIGNAVTAFKPGDAVFGMINFPSHGKAYAEYVAAPQQQLAKKPDNVTHQEAAAATLAALTAWQFLVKQAQIKAQHRVLIHAASGGVGHFAVQIAKHLGAYVIATSSAKNQEFVLSLGADQHIDYQTQEFEKVAADIDIVLDTIGEDYIDRSMELTKKYGIILSAVPGVNQQQKDKAKAKDINLYLLSVESNGEDMQQIAQLMEQGVLKAHVSHTYAFEQMQQAHQQIASGRTVGKVVVTV